MKIEVRKTHFFVLLGALILVAGSFFAYGYGTNNPSNFGHSVGEIDWTSGLITGRINQVHSGSGNIWIQGSATDTAGNSRNLAFYGTNDDRLIINYQSEYVNGTQIGGPVGINTPPSVSHMLRVAGGSVSAPSYCIGDNCITSWPVDTNADTLCSGDTYLNGNGACTTPAQIVSGATRSSFGEYNLELETSGATVASPRNYPVQNGKYFVSISYDRVYSETNVAVENQILTTGTPTSGSVTVTASVSAVVQVSDGSLTVTPRAVSTGAGYRIRHISGFQIQ